MNKRILFALLFANSLSLGLRAKTVTVPLPGGETTTMDVPENIVSIFNEIKNQTVEKYLKMPSKPTWTNFVFKEKEVLEKAEELRKKYQELTKVHVIFSHGTGVSENSWKNQGSWYKEMFEDHSLTQFAFPDVKNHEHSNLGQDTDMNALYDQIETLHENSKGKAKIVLVGFSRGASTIINFLGGNVIKKIGENMQIRNKNHLIKNIIGAVLIAPFSNPEDIIQHHLRWLTKDKSIAKWLNKTFTKKIFPSYDPKGIQPIGVVENINKDIPIIFYTSPKDNTCPSSGVRELYSKIHKARKNNKELKLHFVELYGGTHRKYLTYEDKRDQKKNNYNKIQETLNAFYDKYNITYRDSSEYINDDYQPDPQDWKKKKKKSWESSIAGISGASRRKEEEFDDEDLFVSEEE